jgi:hypothetical protein
MRMSLRLIKSLAILSLGIFVGAKWFSAEPESQIFHNRKIESKYNKVVSETQLPSRGPAGIASDPLKAFGFAESKREPSSASGLEKVENYPKLRVLTNRMEKEFRDTYLRRYFAVANDREGWEEISRQIKPKLDGLAAASQLWKARFTIQILGRSLNAIAKLNLGTPRLGPNGEEIRECGNSHLVLEAEGHEFIVPLNVFCGDTVALRNHRAFVWADTMWDHEVGSVFTYIMIPMPNEGGQGHFLDSKTLKWHTTEEIRWETASEVDFKR